jgi:hypothetical protein
MQSPFDSGAERALYELAAAMPYMEQPRNVDSCFLFSFQARPDAWSAPYALRFVACRASAIAFCVGGIAALPATLLVLGGSTLVSAAARSANLSSVQRAGDRARSACHIFLRWSHRLFDDLLFCFDPNIYAKFCYQRLACYWTRGVCSRILPTGPGAFSPPSVDSPWGENLFSDLRDALVEGNRHAHRWCMALRDSCMGPADFEEVDRRWQRSSFPGSWAPSRAHPSYARLRLACAELAEIESPLFKPSGERARLLASQWEGDDIAAHIPLGTQGSGAKRL